VTGGDQGAGELVLVATPIGNIGDLSPRAAATLQEADVVCCEDTRHTGQLLARLGLRASRLLSVHAHNERERVAEVLELLERGERVAFRGRAQRADGSEHRVEGTVTPADATSGKVKVRVFATASVELIFNTTYRFTGE